MLLLYKQEYTCPGKILIDYTMLLKLEIKLK